jgi:hypothetical protein
MPKNKDWKRLVRARMQKTGESYTTARMQLLRADQPRTKTPPPTDPPSAAKAPAFAKLAGMRDEAVAAKTGRTWAQWVEALDAAGAPALDHTALAELVHTAFGIGGWWSQSVAVGYERIRGRRELHQTAKGFAVSKTRTFAVPLAALRRAFAPAVLRQWLGEAKVTPRKTTPKVARWTEADGTHVDVQLAAKGRGRSVASLQHTKLVSRADVERRRTFWSAKFEALAQWLAARGSGRARFPSTAK